ncbi:nitroreductase [Nocardia pseudobrasiliensis]|uniref:Deazaflavin-dependent oxidoreductase (Nitroreductase family) n=1 Tax=Nocardia pseudobrasiliensis TaxID=45979 RepID=A0A370HPG1_9NOCA|nr:nitroreductase [Nocardia pseudobrasiliensis]RDI60466.1 deazaflavin-dependent oxidoreductase (nitroreductase family) [Nocardia pseudobrasiliensis]
MTDKRRTSDRATPIRDALRIVNKYVTNPAMMHLAGRKHWYASVIRHTGRRTGESYATPVVAERVADGFIIPLPYGTRVDWLRHVLSSGRATIRTGGRTYDVVEPEIIDAASAAPQLSPERRRAFQRFGSKHYLKLRSVPTTSR